MQFVGTPADCASLGISGKLFDGVTPDLVNSQLNALNTYFINNILVQQNLV